VSACRSARSPIQETLSVFEEPRCKRFDVVEPLAPPPSVRVETPSVCGERRCERFDAENVRATGLWACPQPLSVLGEALFLFAEQRCKSFDASEPLASPLSACIETPSAFEETRSVLAGHVSAIVGGGKRPAPWPSACREPLSALEGRLTALGERRCKRSGASEPLASRLSTFEETRSVFREARWQRFGAVEPLASGRSSNAGRLPAEQGRTEKRLPPSPRFAGPGPRFATGHAAAHATRYGGVGRTARAPCGLRASLFGAAVDRRAGRATFGSAARVELGDRRRAVARGARVTG